MMSMKSMEKSYCCLTELESKGLFSTCSKFIMNLGESLDVEDSVYRTHKHSYNFSSSNKLIKLPLISLP